MKVQIGSVELDCVREVTRERSIARDSYIAADGEGAPARTWNIAGHILGSPTGIVQEQSNLEDSVAGEGDTTIRIVDHAGSVLAQFDGRVTQVSWRPYSTGPISFYEMTVETESQSNPFAGEVNLGGFVLNDPTPSIVEQYRVVNDDDPMDTAHSRTFRVRGRKRSDPAGVETFIDALENAVTAGAGSTGYFTLVTSTGSFEVRCTNLEISRPEEIDAQGAVTYSLDLESRPDYSLESFNLPHPNVNVGGITWDVVQSFSHAIGRVQKGTSAIYRITSESMSWSLKKFFTNFGNIAAIKSQVDNLVNNRLTMVSPTGQVLECKSASYNVPSIDGHDTADSKRYALTVSITFGKPDNQRDNPGGVVFGIYFEEISSDSRGVSIDENGGITSRNRNVSGRVAAKPDISILGSKVVETDGEYHVTGYNVGKLDADGFWEISLSARTLATAEQCNTLIDEIFEGVHFNSITSHSRSVSRSQRLDSNILEVTSVSESVSGEVWGVDARSLLTLVDAFTSSYGIPKITNMSVGKQEPFTNPNTGECTWKQSVSLTRVTQSRPTEEDEQGEEDGDDEGDPPKFDEFQPDVKDETTTEFSKQTDRFQAITIPGGKVVMKKVGINPATVRVRKQRTARNFRIFNTMSAPVAPGVPGGFTSGNALSRDASGEQGLTKYVERAWIATSVES